MLAAASSRSDRTLESVKLALRLEALEQKSPESLRDYLKTVVLQAVELTKRPAEVASTTLPEAISLAVRASSDPELTEILLALIGEGNITSEKAAKALDNLETTFEPVGESAHFSREIYAAI